MVLVHLNVKQLAPKFCHFTYLYFACNISGFHDGVMKKQVF
jgi:hypothetical protein